MAEVKEKAPIILRRFKSDKKCGTALGSLHIPLKRKVDRNNPETSEICSIDFISMENKIGDELIQWCELTIDENARIPSDIVGTIPEIRDGQLHKHPVADMKIGDYLTKTWEFNNGYLREDKEFHEISRLKFLEHENKLLKEQVAKSEGKSTKGDK